MEDFSKLKVDQLKAALKKRNINFNAKDKKADLVKLLESSVVKTEIVIDEVLSVGEIDETKVSSVSIEVPSTASAETSGIEETISVLQESIEKPIESNGSDSHVNEVNETASKIEHNIESENIQNDVDTDHKNDTITKPDTNDHNQPESVVIETPPTTEKSSSPKKDNIVDMESEEKRLRELALSQMKQRKLKEVNKSGTNNTHTNHNKTTVISNNNAIETVSNHVEEDECNENIPYTVRINYLQRPLQLNTLKQWLNEKCETVIPDDKIWLALPLKTHCYIEFPTKIEAKKCIERISGLQYPSASAFKLTVTISAITLDEAKNGHKEASLSPKEYETFILQQQQQASVHTPNKSKVNMNNGKLSVNTTTTTTTTSHSLANPDNNTNNSGLNSTRSVGTVSSSFTPRGGTSSSTHIDDSKGVSHVLKKALLTSSNNGSPRAFPSSTSPVTTTTTAAAVTAVAVTEYGNSSLISGNLQQGFVTRKYRQQNIIQSVDGDMSHLKHTTSSSSSTTTTTTNVNVATVDRSSHKRGRDTYDDNIYNSSTNKSNRQNTSDSIHHTDNAHSVDEEDMDSSLLPKSSIQDALSLDDLFKKTKALPSLYWLPVEDSLIKIRKDNEHDTNITYAQKYAISNHEFYSQQVSSPPEAVRESNNNTYPNQRPGSYSNTYTDDYSAHRGGRGSGGGGRGGGYTRDYSASSGGGRGMQSDSRRSFNSRDRQSYPLSQPKRS